MQTILGANGVIGRELSLHLPQYSNSRPCRNTPSAVSQAWHALTSKEPITGEQYVRIACELAHRPYATPGGAALAAQDDGHLRARGARDRRLVLRGLLGEEPVADDPGRDEPRDEEDDDSRANLGDHGHLPRLLRAQLRR